MGWCFGKLTQKKQTLIVPFPLGIRVLIPCNSLYWRHNERDGVSNHQPHDCLLNRLLRGRSKKTSKLRVAGLCEGNSPVTGEFPAQWTSNAENVSIWWRRHVNVSELIIYVGGFQPPWHYQCRSIRRKCIFMFIKKNQRKKGWFALYRHVTVTHPETRKSQQTWGGTEAGFEIWWWFTGIGYGNVSDNYHNYCPTLSCLNSCWEKVITQVSWNENIDGLLWGIPQITSASVIGEALQAGDRPQVAMTLHDVRGDKDRDGVSTGQRLECLLNPLFRRISKKAA